MNESSTLSIIVVAIGSIGGMVGSAALWQLNRIFKELDVHDKKLDDGAKERAEQSEDIARLQTAFEIYLNRTDRGAVKVLRKPNPTPLRILMLFRKLERGDLGEEERDELVGWLVSVEDDTTKSAGERYAAIHLAGSIAASNELRVRVGENREHHSGTSDRHASNDR